MNLSLHKGHAFSLVELLTVVAIIAVLMTVTAPGIGSIMKARNLNRGGNLVVDLTQQARQNAMTKNAMTALVLVNGSGNEKWNNRAFILMELLPGGTAWTAASRWYDLPEGVILDASESARFLQSPLLAVPIGSLSRAGTAISGSQYVYQVFLPEGQLSQSGVTNSQPPSLHLIEGVMSGASLVRMSQGNYYEVIINQFTGLTSVVRP